jgi:hypothetical protein
LTAFAVVAIALMIGTVSTIGTVPDGRSVRPLSLLSPEPSEKFDPAQSAALFVGVREFDGDVPLVRYAVDDAVDLAYAFSLGGRSGLVTPPRVVLALSGHPQKPESQERLRKLRAAGTAVTDATTANIRSLLQQQVARVTNGGLLIASFATHGFVDDDGVHYLLGRTSTFDARDALSATEVLDDASRASRSLVLVDACRERVPSGSRAAPGAPNSTAPMITRMTPLSGQVVFYAATAGGYAFDADGNGVFTNAVLQGLACKGPTAKIMNVERLHRYVDKRVGEWVQRNRPGNGRGGIQINTDGRTRLMPLANCNCSAAPEPSDTWRAALTLPVSRSEIADLDGDCTNEVIANAGGVLHVFDADGALRWSGGEAIREFVVAPPYGERRPVLAFLAKGFSVFDYEGKTLCSVRGDLQHVGIYRPTTRYDNRIVATTDDIVLLFTMKNPIAAWRRRVGGTVEAVEIHDHDKDGKLDLVLRTAAGPVVLDVDGHSLNGAHVEKLTRK